MWHDDNWGTMEFCNTRSMRARISNCRADTNSSVSHNAQAAKVAAAVPATKMSLLKQNNVREANRIKPTLWGLRRMLGKGLPPVVG